MLHNQVLKIVFFVAATGVHAKLNAQQKTNVCGVVDIRDSRSHTVALNITDPSYAEITNGEFSIIVTASEGYLLEITGIKVPDLDCGKSLHPHKYRLALISRKENVTYRQHPKDRTGLLIACTSLQPGSDISIKLKTTLHAKSRKVTLNASLKGKIPEKTYLQTN
jgi:hypothetical protein